MDCIPAETLLGRSMERYIVFADKVSAWFGKAFAWLILVMTFGVGYEVFVRYVLRDPTSWSFDVSYMMYGTLLKDIVSSIRK